MWRGEHIGPRGTTSGVMYADWSDAADWLRAMMRVVFPPGIEDALVALRDAMRDQPFYARVGRNGCVSYDDGGSEAGSHLFRIERDGSP